MARPKTGRNGKRYNVYLDAAVVTKAAKLAAANKTSLSAMIEGALRKRLKREGIAVAA